MPRKPGDRVGAVFSQKGATLYLLGYGVYAGKEVPPPGQVKFWGVFDLGEAGYTDRKLMLDDGQVVWGTECWWDSEARVKELEAAADQVVMVDMQTERDKCDAREAGVAAEPTEAEVAASGAEFLPAPGRDREP